MSWLSDLFRVAKPLIEASVLHEIEQELKKKIGDTNAALVMQILKAKLKL